MTIVYSPIVPAGIIIEGKNFIIVGTKEGEHHGERVLSEAREYMELYR